MAATDARRASHELAESSSKSRHQPPWNRRTRPHQRAAPTYASGRAQTARRWFQWFEEQGLIERYPLIAMQGAFLQVLAGQPEDIERWTAAAERGLAARTLARSSTMEPWMALLPALLCRDRTGPGVGGTL